MEKQDPPDQRVTRFLQIFDQFKPRIIWIVIVLAAIYSLFWPSTIMGLVEFVILTALAEGHLSPLQVIGLFRGKLSLLSLAERDADSQPGGTATDDQDEPTE